MEPLSALVGRQSGVISRCQALKYLSAKAIRHKVDSGRWARVGHGVFLTATGPPTNRQRDWAAVLGAGGDRKPGICLGGISALRTWGLRAVAPDAIHVLAWTPRQPMSTHGVIIHRTRLPLDDIGFTRPPATMPGRSVVDAVAWARSDREAQLIVAASFQQGLVTFADVERATASRRNLHRRALLLGTAADCGGGSHSVADLDLLAVCRDTSYRSPPPRCLDSTAEGG